MITGIARRLKNKSPRAIAAALRWRLTRPWHLYRVRNAPEYASPTADELARVEADLRTLNVPVTDYHADLDAFRLFADGAGFPSDYHGGIDGGVYREKILEHFIAWDLLGLQKDSRRLPYVDIASAASPWAALLRERGVEAFSIDLEKNSRFSSLDYYLQGDATASPFGPASVGSASLQCAFEMFESDADVRLIAELARLLRPGGRAVISPLYMHTHACCYQSPEYFGRRHTDVGAKAYVRRNASRVPSSRKYSAATLVSRVWSPAIANGLRPSLLVLRNAAAIGADVYLHFILLLDNDER